jgi:hypothetical protein
MVIVAGRLSMQQSHSLSRDNPSLCQLREGWPSCGEQASTHPLLRSQKPSSHCQSAPIVDGIRSDAKFASTVDIDAYLGTITLSDDPE